MWQTHETETYFLKRELRHLFQGFDFFLGKKWDLGKEVTCRRLAAQITDWGVGVRVEEGGAHIVLELNCGVFIEAVIGKRKHKDLNKCRKLQFVMVHLESCIHFWLPDDFCSSFQLLRVSKPKGSLRD